MSETEKMKNCPFCNEKPRIKVSFYMDEFAQPFFDIECYECNRASTKEGYCSLGQAIKEWNYRGE